MGDANHRLGDHDRALSNYIEYFDRFPVTHGGDSNPLNMATEVLSNEIDRNPDNADAFRARALLHARGTTRHRAWRDFDRAIELEPLRADTYFHRAVYRLNPGQEHADDVVGKMREDFNRSLDLGYEVERCRADEECAFLLEFLEAELE